jgi:hypothetical protein
MNERWRKMLRFGIVQRKVSGDKPPLAVEYRLTPFGRRFVRILDEVRRLQKAVDRGGVRPGSAPGVLTTGPDDTTATPKATGEESPTGRRRRARRAVIKNS